MDGPLGRQFFFLSIGCPIELKFLLGFMKFFFKQILKVSAFYLEKQKSFIPKKYIF